MCRTAKVPPLRPFTSAPAHWVNLRVSTKRTRIQGQIPFPVDDFWSCFWSFQLVVREKVSEGSIAVLPRHLRQPTNVVVR